MEWSIYGVNEKSEGPTDKGARSGNCVDARGIAWVWMGGTGAVEEEESVVSGGAEVVGTSDLLPLAFLGPLNVTVGSSRFQQFFLIYVKLMAGLNFSRDLESD